MDSRRILLAGSRTLQRRLESGITIKATWPSRPEVQGNNVKFAGLRQCAKTIWRDAYRVQAIPTSENARFRGGGVLESERCRCV